MGIQGLKHYLTAHAANSVLSFDINEIIPPNSNVIIDGLGWIFYLVAQFESERRYGGNYMEIDAITRDGFYELIDMGISVTVFLDGHASKLKDLESKKRRLQRSQQWLKLYDITLGDERKKKESDLVLPPLAISQFISTLHTLGVHIHQCKGEADYDIAFYCSKRIEITGQPTFCYGFDRYCCCCCCCCHLCCN